MAHRLIPLLAVLLALGAAAPARALTTISSNVTLPGNPVFGSNITDDIEVTGSAVPTINAGGSITGNVSVLQTGTVNISGGAIGGGLSAFDSSIINVSDGQLLGVSAYESSTVSVTGGEMGIDLRALDSSTVTISGGDIGGDLTAEGNSTVTITNGAIDGNLFARDNSTINRSGGVMGGGLVAGGNSTVNYSGGAAGIAVAAEDSGTLKVFGCNLQIAGGIITGTLLDGTVLDALASTSGGGQIILVQQDLAAPSIQNLTVTPAQLWPASHNMVSVTVSYTVSDNCGPATWTLTATSNEPDNGLGDGDTAGDIQILDAHHLKLRAERSGKGSGRV